ncbi:MAG: tripartite tricarboxylate transporter substrate binding protein [Betaproteobacteria bacterium]|nr:tripartite tricarboxylate transporter substrate binding protein [Betaproteobacteria bacterium]
MVVQRLATALCAAAIAGSPGPGGAQAQGGRDYPGKPLRWVLGFPAGGVSDLLARTVGQKLAETLGQQIVIDNRPGASGIVASALAAKAPANGYTLMLGETSTHSVNVSLFKKLPYNPLADFAPVTLLAESPLVLVVAPTLAVASVQELITVAKAKPGNLNYASGGSGTGTHLVAELFKSTTRIQLTHVPYKGTPPAITDLLGGRVDLMFPNLPPVIGQIKTARLKAIAVSSGRRLPSLPDVPAIAETVSGFVANTWYGVLVPAGTPRPVVQRLNAAIVEVVAIPELRERLSGFGFEVATSTPEGLAQYMRGEIGKWAQVIAEAGIKAE